MFCSLRLSLFLFAFLVASLYFPTLLKCADDDAEKRLQVFDLGKIEVVGQAEKPENNAQTTVSEAEFDANLNADVSEALENVPGVLMSVGAKNEPQIMLRGMEQNRILILNDGIPVAAPYYGDLDTSELALGNISEIKIVRGNASVLYGPNALGGVISIVSAKPGSRPNFNVLAVVDQEGNYVTRLSGGIRRDSLYYQLALGARDSNGWRMSHDFNPTFDDDGNMLENGDIRDHSAYNQWNAGLKVGKQWDTGELSLAFDFEDADKEIPTTTSSAVRIRFWRFPKWRKYSTILAGKTWLKEDLDVRFNLFYHKYDNVLQSFGEPDYTRLQWESTYDDYSTGLITRMAWELSDSVTIRTLVNAIFDHHSGRSDRDDPWEKYNTLTQSYASECEWRLNSALSVLLGAGWDVFDIRSTHQVPGAEESLSRRSNSTDALTFSFLTTYTTCEGQEFTVAVSLKNRFPTLHEMFSNIEDFGPEDISTLKTEHAWEYAVGYDLHAENYQLGTSLFYYDVDNLIDRSNRHSLYENIDKSDYKGLELWGSYGKKTGFNTRISYTYTDAENKSADRITRSLPHIPKHLVHVNAGYRFSSASEVALGYSYRDSVIEIGGKGDTVFTVPGYAVWDATLKHAFEWGLTVTLQGLNLLDKNYYQEIGFEQPGREIKLGLQYRL